MRYAAWSSLLGAAGVSLALAACGDTPEQTGSTSGTTTTTTTTSSGMGGMGGAMTTGTGGSGTGGAGGQWGNPNLLNGGDPMTADDHTGQAMVDIMFPVGGFKYAPPCITVSTKTKVTFTGDFVAHPLVGGQILNGAKKPD